MPTINLGTGKARDRTVNKAAYQSIYQDSRWKSLRLQKLKDNPVCELCDLEGKTSPTKEIHHKIPFDISMSQEQIEALAFDYDNLISLCIPCHKKQHLKRC